MCKNGLLEVVNKNKKPEPVANRHKVRISLLWWVALLPIQIFLLEWIFLLFHAFLLTLDLTGEMNIMKSNDKNR